MSVDDALDDDRRLVRLDLVEQLGQRRLAAILVLLGRYVLLGLQRLLGELEQLLQELDAVEQPCSSAVLQRLEALRELLELGIAAVLAQPAL